ncbi:MAG: 16S rRNA (guanine(527)-N(7))-methyltransferase RsmG [Candidatus Acidiferrales bacterium]
MGKIIPAEIATDQVVKGLAPFGIRLSDLQLNQVREYVRLLLKWNRSMSLTTVTNPVEIVSRHFGESFFVTALLPMERGRLADLGSGAGFPGLALKILQPGLRVCLIESNKKKCAFLSEVTRALDLHDVEILPERFGDVRPERDFADFVTARALGGFPVLLRWARAGLSVRGHVLLWAGGEDIPGITNSPGWIWNPPARIPESLRRYILVGRYIGDQK